MSAQDQQSASQNQDIKSSQSDDEISLGDILAFVRGHYLTIAAFALVGLLAALVYVWLTPNRYEASAQIFMAQVGTVTSNNNNKNNKNPLGNDLEEPSLVAARLASPTSLSPDLIAACGYSDGDSDAASSLAKSMKLTAPKGIASVVELKVTSSSPQTAGHCANAVFQQVKQSQADLLMPFIEDAKTLLAADEARLKTAQEILLKADKSGSAMSATYLSTRDEIRYLLDEIAGLKNMLNSSQTRSTRLVSPVYVNPRPVSPKKPLLLGLGLAVGLLIGLLTAYVRQQLIGAQSAKANISENEGA